MCYRRVTTFSSGAVYDTSSQTGHSRSRHRYDVQHFEH